MIESNSWVHLIEQKEYDIPAMVSKLKAVFTQERLDFHNKTILLKVSFVFPVRNAERTKMIITNPKLIAATCQVLAEAGAKKIFIGDGETIGPARYEFTMVEMDKYLQEIPKPCQKCVEFVYFDECYKKIITPPNAIVPNIQLDYPKIALDVDYLISMPKLKANVFANITLTVKNGMGFVTSKTRWKYHNDNLHGMISDIFQIRPPDFAITDAVFAGEGQGPMQADPYPTNLILVGNNALAVDTICCNLMGIDPNSVKHLHILSDRGYGPLDFSEIRLEHPDLFDQHKHHFKLPEVSLAQINPHIHYYIGQGCQCGCPAFIRAIMDAYGMNLGWNWMNGKDLYIIVGKDAPVPPELLKNLPKRRTIIFGDCAQAYRKYGIYSKGCIPNYLFSMFIYGYKSDMGKSPWLKYVSYRIIAWEYIKHFVALLSGKKYKILKN